jgi:predicted ATPase
MYLPAITPAAFIGRSQEIDEIRALLDDPACRLLTLVGPGGIGKTRLATELAERLQMAFPDGVYFVPLAPLTHPAQILTAVAEATPFRFQQDSRDPHEQFFAYLREKHAKRTLFVLDNFEHLLDGAEIVSGMLAATTGTKILVTSREAQSSGRVGAPTKRPVLSVCFRWPPAGNVQRRAPVSRCRAPRARRFFVVRP